MVPQQCVQTGLACGMEAGANQGGKEAGAAGHLKLAAADTEGSEDLVGSDELLMLIAGPDYRHTDERDGTEKLLDYLYVLFSRAGIELRSDMPVEHQLMRVDPDARIVFAEFFDAQRFVKIASDASQPAWRREIAARVLEAGSVQFYFLCVDGHAARLGELPYLIVAEQKKQGYLLRAVDTLRLFTGLEAGVCARMVRECFQAADRRDS